MDFEAELVSSIEVTMQAAVEAAVERSMQALTAAMRAYTDNSKRRILREIKEMEHALDVGAHNVDTRAALASAETTFDASVKRQATVVFGNGPDMAVSHGVDLAATSPVTCSTQYPSRAVTMLVTALAPADVYSITPIRDSVFEESENERTRRLRRRIQLAEDRARRDPVWAEKMARRHAAFRVTTPSTAASAMATSTSSASACAVCDGNLVAASSMPALTLTAAMTSSTGTGDIVPEVAAPETSALALAIDTTVGATPMPTICSTGGRDENLDGDEPVASCHIPSCGDALDANDISAEENMLEVLTFQRLKLFSGSTLYARVQWPLPLANQDMIWTESLPVSQVWTVWFSNFNGDFDPGIELLVNLSESKEPGICYDLGCACATTRLISLLPWDPGVKTGVSRDSILRRDSVCSACVKKVDADLSGSHDHDQKFGYAETQIYFHWPIQMFYSSENAFGKCSCKDIYVQLLQNQFDGPVPFTKQYLEASIYPAIRATLVPFENFLVGSSGDGQRNFPPLYPEASGYWLLKASSVPYNCAPGTAGLVFPDGSIFLWELAWPSLFDVWAIHSTSQLWSYILRSTVLQILAYGTSPFKEPMKQWDPGIARWITRHIRRGNTHYSGLLEWSYFQSELEVCIRRNIIYCCCVLEQWKIPWTLSLLSLKSRFSYSSIAVNCHFTRVPIMLSDRTQMNEKSMLRTSLKLVVYLVHPALNIEDQGSLKSYRLLISKRDSLCTRWRNAKQLISADILCQKQLCYRPTAEIFSSDAHCEEIYQANFIAVGFAAWYVLCARPRSTEIFSVHYKARSKGHENIFGDYKRATRATNVDPIILYINLVHIGRNYCFDHACCFDNVHADDDYYYDTFFAQVHAGQDLYLHTYLDKVHIDNDYYIGIFLEQVDAICCLNLVKVCLYYGFHHDLNEVLKQVPCDPGGSSWHRLEVKPKIKEGGMLATLPCISVGWTMGRVHWAWASRKLLDAATYTKGLAPDDLAWNGTASASSASVFSFL